jgi:hypothetical protein
MFALHNGKRINAIYPRHFPCTSNPVVLAQVVEDVKQVIAKKPSTKVIRFFSDAPVRSCSCDNCRNSPVGKQVKAAGDSSETVYAFYSKIGRELQKSHPDLIFHIQTKGNSYKNPPQTEKLPDNTVIALLTGHYNAPDYYAVQKRAEAWKAAGAAHVVLHCYPRPPGMKDYPIVNPHRIAEHFKKLQGHTEGLIRAEGSGKIPYTFSALNNYIHSAVMFDTAIDPDALIKKFCQLVSPAAAVELGGFYSEMENLLKGAGFWDDAIVNCYLSFRLKTPREWLNKALAKDKNNPFRLMGFGHRVYKTYDPRAKIIREECHKLLAHMDIHDPLLDVARELEEYALTDPYFKERNLYPNVDFYTGIMYRALGIPENMFTVMFALARLPGWIAHWKEMIGGATKIVRPRQIYIGQTPADKN